MANIEYKPVWSEDGQTLSNVLVKDKLETYNVVTEWYDGTPLDDSKLDSDLVYVKYEGKYLVRNFEYGQVLQKDTMQDMRDLSPYEILLLKMGVYKHVQLNGYYEEGDTPSPINYILSDTEDEDDGGSVISVEDIKLEHEFVGNVNILYYGFETLGVEEYIHKVIEKFEGVELPSRDMYVGGDIELNKDYITLQGQGSGSKLIFSENNSNRIIVSNSENTTLKNFGVDGGGGGKEDGGIVFSYNSKNFTAENLSIKNTGDKTNGISVYVSPELRSEYSCRIVNNYIQDTGKSSLYINTDNSVVSGNICKNSGIGNPLFSTPLIQLRSCKNVTVVGNTCQNSSQAGIYLFNSEGYSEGSHFENVVIQGNVIRGSRIGVLVERTPQNVAELNLDSNKVIIANNTIDLKGEDTSEGIKIRNVSDINVIGNIISHSRFGVSVDNSEYVNISNNMTYNVTNISLRVGSSTLRGGKFFTITGNTNRADLDNTLIGIQIINGMEVTLLGNIMNFVNTGITTNNVTNILNRQGNSFDYKETYAGSVAPLMKRNLGDVILPLAITRGGYSGFVVTKEGTSVTTSVAPPWGAGQTISEGDRRTSSGNLYVAENSGVTGSTAPTHTSGSQLDGTVEWLYEDKVAETSRIGFYSYGVPYSNAGAPSSPSVGYMYYSTTDKEPKWWEGSEYRGLPKTATTGVEGLVRKAVAVPDGSSIDDLLQALRNAGIIEE